MKFKKSTKYFGVHADRVNELYMDKGLNNRRLTRSMNKIKTPNFTESSDPMKAWNQLNQYAAGIDNRVTDSVNKMPNKKYKFGGTKSKTPDRVLDIEYKRNPDSIRIPAEYKLKKIMEEFKS